MALITSFNALRELAVTQGNKPQYGLCSDDGSISGCGVQGSGLSGMQIQVNYTRGLGPVWTGTLSTGNSSEWIADLTCAVTGVGGRLGDPEDVQVTVIVGTNLRNGVDATLPTVPVKVGPAPK